MNPQIQRMHYKVYAKQFDQAIKSIFFLYTFVNWARVYIKDHTTSMLDFVDRLSLK